MSFANWSNYEVPDFAHYHPNPEANSFSEFFGEDRPSEFADLSDYGLYPDTFAGDPDWEALFAMGIDPLGAVRLAFPEMGEMDDSYIEAELQTLLSTMSEAEIESFWKWVKKSARKVAGVASRVIKPVARVAGGALGTVVGGPIGTALGQKLGGAIGGLASRGLSQVSRGGFRGRRIFKQIRRNAQQAVNRVRRGQPIFNNQQVRGAISQIQGLLNNPQISALLGPQEIYAENFGEISGESIDAELMEIASDIIEAASILEAALEETNSAYDIAYESENGW